MFIAVVGISAGPSFVQGLKEVGPMLFIIGALATSTSAQANRYSADMDCKFSDDTQKTIFQPKIGLHTPSKLYAWRQYTPY